jgi:hypothetical protein
MFVSIDLAVEKTELLKTLMAKLFNKPLFAIDKVLGMQRII